MVKDSLESSHSINVKVNDPSEINSLFDDITYNKVNIYRIICCFIVLEIICNLIFERVPA